ncbi:MAG: SpaA isopeptide-forming pilin-related protein [Lachnospiraceae bacterium]|nr:SpaA isopeptide-forming pilin-related protein [Lachnospiraceae bacterium]
MKKKLRVKQILSGMMAVVTLLSTAISPITAYAAEPEKVNLEYPTFEEVKEALSQEEVVTAKDYEVEMGAKFDVEIDFTGIEILDDSKVKVTFHEAKNEAGDDFSTEKVDTYKAVYYVEPVSGHPSYQIQRNLIVKETSIKEGDTGTASENGGNTAPTEEESEDAEESDSQTEITLPENEELKEPESDSGATKPETENTEDTVTEEETEDASEAPTEETKTDAVLEDHMITSEETVNKEDTAVKTEERRDFDGMSDEELCIAAEAMIQAQIDSGEYELEFFGEDLELFMLYQNIMNFGNRYGSKARAATGSLVVKNANHESGMWNLPLLDYIYSSKTGGQVHNYVKYIADDADNGWRMAYCTQVSKHFIDSTSYIGKTWQANGMHSEISYAIAHGCSVYGDKNDSAYSTGGWLKDYYVTQTVIYCILSDYGYDGHALSSLSAVSGYQDVYDCVQAMYQDVKKNAGKDGYGDKPTYKITAPSSTKMTLTADGAYYRSDWYTIDSTGEIKSKSIKLSGAPDGCEIVYNNANNLKSKFYIQIPVAKAYQMPTDTVSFKVQSNAKFERPFIYIYNSQIADAQNITFQEKQTPSETVDSEASVSITLDKCKVAVHKVDAESGNGVAGAEYGVYSDSDCKKLIAKMPKTNADGHAEVEFVKRQNQVYVKEIKASVNYLINTTSQNVQVTAKQTSTLKVTEQPAKGKITVKKQDNETNSFTPQADATMEGAVYGLYAKEDIIHPDGHTGVVYPAGTLVAQKTFGSSGEIAFENLYFGSYFVKEISNPVGYLLDQKEYPVSVSYADQNTPVVVVGTTVLEQVMKQAFEIIKISSDGSSTETKLVEGAEFTIKLESDIKANGWDNAKVYDTLITDAKGYAKSIELPYGTYHIKETKTPADMNTTKDFYVTVSEDSRTPQVWRVFNDAPFKAYIRLIKKDVDTGKIVQLAGTTFKIRDLSTGEDVSMKVGSEHITTFTTDETGMVTTPLMMLPGEYEVYEITAPFGYVVRTESIPFTVTSKGEYHTDDDGDFVVDVEINNIQQYGNVNLYKHGEALAKVEKEGGLVEMVKSLITGEKRNLNFVYEDQPIEGSVFHIICDEDIYTADNQTDAEGNRILATYQGVELKQGAVAAILTTDKEGKAVAEKLPLGKYHIEETQASHGYVLNDTQDAFILEYAGQETELVYHDSEYENERQKTALSLIKTSTKEEKAVEGAEYGLYAKEDVLSAEGEILVEADTLIETQITNAEGKISFTADFPLGNYYVKEIKAAPGYLLDEETYDVDFTYQGQDVKVVTNTLEVKDEPTITEISKTDITTGEEVIGAKLEILNESGEVVESWTSTEEKHIVYGLPAGDYLLRETSAPTEQGYVKAEDVPFTIEETGEVQKVEMKDDFTKVEISKVDITDGSTEIEGAKLYILDQENKVIDSWVSTKEAHLIERLPVGKYSLLEEIAPKGYIISNKITFEVEETGEIQKVIMEDAYAMGKIILNKTDKDSKKPLKGVEFTIYDSEGKELETLVTDSAGHAESKEYPIATFKDGKYDQQLTYTVKETKTLDGYKLDETKHEVKFEYVDDKTPVIEYKLDVTNEKVPEADTPKNPSSPDTPSTTTTTTSAPKTGDESNIAVLLLLMGISAGGVSSLLWLKKRKR